MLSCASQVGSTYARMGGDSSQAGPPTGYLAERNGAHRQTRVDTPFTPKEMK